VLRYGLHHGLHVNIVGQVAPHAAQESPTYPQNPTHLADGHSAIRTKLETLLTQHDIKGALLERERFQAAFLPRDGCPVRRWGRPRHCYHARVEVEPSDVAHTGRRHARDNARATGRI